jgi:hypothetical protein
VIPDAINAEFAVAEIAVDINLELWLQIEFWFGRFGIWLVTQNRYCSSHSLSDWLIIVVRRTVAKKIGNLGSDGTVIGGVETIRHHVKGRVCNPNCAQSLLWGGWVATQ